jgi:hypothetical protein
MPQTKEIFAYAAPYVAYVALGLALWSLVRIVGHIEPASELHKKKTSSLSSDSPERFGNARIGKVGTILRSQIPMADRNAFDSRVLQATAPAEKVDIPTQYNFAKSFPNLSSSVLNQKDCGSCWAFSVAGAASDRIRRQAPIFFDTMVELNGVKVRNQLSPYLLASCDNCSLLDQQPDFVRNAKLVIDADKCSVGCDGGVIEYALIYLDQNGLISIECNQGYAGQYKCHSLANLKQIEDQLRKENVKANKKCKYWQFKRPVKVHIYESSELTTPERLAANEKSIQTEIMLWGPVCAGYMVYQSFYDFFEKNPKGIYTPAARPPEDEEKGGHAVIYTGWGEENGVKYWIVRNSWGPEWGDAGYFKILRGQNFCEAESDVFAPQVHKEWLAWIVKITQSNQEIPELAFLRNFPDNINDIDEYLAELQKEQDRWLSPTQTWILISIVSSLVIAGGSYWYLHR